MIEHLTPELVMHYLEEIVTDYGRDRVYNAGENEFLECVYVHGTTLESYDVDADGDPLYREVVDVELEPGCLVGHALIRAGIAPEAFLELGINRNTDALGAIQALKGAGHIQQADVYAVDLLAFAQQEQDGGKPWAVARDVALQHYLRQLDGKG